MFDGTLSGFRSRSRPYARPPGGVGQRGHREGASGRDGGCLICTSCGGSGRLHIRCQTAAWVAGLMPHPFMRSPMPKPKQAEIDALRRLLKTWACPSSRKKPHASLDNGDEDDSGAGKSGMRSLFDRVDRKGSREQLLRVFNWDELKPSMSEVGQNLK